MKRPIILAAIAAQLLLPPLALADLVSIDAIKDNTLYEDPGGALSNGSGQYLFTGKTASNFIRRALLAFDVAGSVPAGSQINSATMTLHMSRTATAAESVDLYRVGADWGEGASDAFGEEGGGTLAEPGDATWIHTFHSGSFWSAAGGDLDGAALASQIIFGNGDYFWSSTDVAATVQDWLDAPAGNFGFALLGNESFAFTAKRFDSRESPDPAVRPRLTIDYTPVPEPTSSFWLSAAIWLILRPATPGRRTSQCWRA